MNVSMSSASASAGTAGLYASRMSRTGSSASTARSGSGSDSDAASATGARPPPPSGPPPSQGGDAGSSRAFDLQLSTRQFAGMSSSGEARAPRDFAALDSDSDGAVSSEEFGLDSATGELQQLFAAIDADSDGSLSSDEVGSFKETLASQTDGPQGAGRPQGPPPGPPPGMSAEGDEEESGGSDASDSSSSSNSGDSLAATAKSDVSALLQRLAEQYLGQLGSTTGAASASLSLTA